MTARYRNPLFDVSISNPAERALDSTLSTDGTRKLDPAPQDYLAWVAASSMTLATSLGWEM